MNCLSRNGIAALFAVLILTIGVIAPLRSALAQNLAQDYVGELAQAPAGHMACSATGFARFNSLQAFASTLIFSGIDIEACARHLQMVIVDNFLVLNFEEFDALLVTAELQRSGTLQIPLFAGPFFCPPDPVVSQSGQRPSAGLSHSG